MGGVCAGVANYLNMDPTLVRVLTVVISLFTGVPVILYIVALFVMPEEGSQPKPPNYPPVGGPASSSGRLLADATADRSSGICPHTPVVKFRARAASVFSSRSGFGR